MQMLLLEGDDMNQKTGICILLCLVLLLVFGIWYQKRGVENTKNTQEQYASETEHTVLTGTPYKETENAYIIRTQDSRLVVFLPEWIPVSRMVLRCRASQTDKDHSHGS